MRDHRSQASLEAMRDLVALILAWVRSVLRSRQDLALENLALRQQLMVIQRGQPRPRLQTSDRLFWIALMRVWGRWRVALVKPDTVVGWHRIGSRAHWAKKCGPGPGRPRIDKELRNLIRRMAEANPLWGAPRIQSELAMLGEATVSRYLGKSNPRRTSQTWKAFLDNHVRDVVAVDFFSVPTAAFRVLFVFVVLSHDRRRILHVNVTDRPTAKWTGRQPLSLGKDTPDGRMVERASMGEVRAIPAVGGLHHRYTRRAA